METFVVYVNDSSHAMQQVLPMLETRDAAQWVLVACPPHLSQHAMRWITHDALQQWRKEWAEKCLEPLVKCIQSHGDQVTTRVATDNLVDMTQSLQKAWEHVRVVDARSQHWGQHLAPVTPGQPHETAEWAVPAGVVALGAAMVAMAAE